MIKAADPMITVVVNAVKAMLRSSLLVEQIDVRFRAIHSILRGTASQICVEILWSRLELTCAGAPWLQV